VAYRITSVVYPVITLLYVVFFFAMSIAGDGIGPFVLTTAPVLVFSLMFVGQLYSSIFRGEVILPVKYVESSGTRYVVGSVVLWLGHLITSICCLAILILLLASKDMEHGGGTGASLVAIGAFLALLISALLYTIGFLVIDTDVSAWRRNESAT